VDMSTTPKIFLVHVVGKKMAATKIII